MSKYSEYNYALVSSVNNLREISQVLVLLKNIKRKRAEPVAGYNRNKRSNINIANNMLEIARQKYEVAIQDMNVAGIMPTCWIPSFEELNDIAETAEERDI